MNNILTTLIFLPIIGGILLFFMGSDANASRIRLTALLVNLVTLALGVMLYQHFDIANGAMQYVESYSWFPIYHIRYDLGIDGFSLALILLTNFTTLLVILGTWHSIKQNIAQYFAAFLIMQGLMVGVFAATDAILFYVFWEATLIPMYLIIGIWGSSNRVYASIKFFLYTFLGSALMLIAFLYLFMKANSFSLADLYAVKLTLREQQWIFLAFLLAFAVKIPMWPVHTWLPDAHTEAPAGGSVILAAIMLKMGAYGFYRFSLPIVPDASAYFAWMMIGLSLVAVVYIGFVAIVQRDMKRLIAYSSISHMGIVTLGCFMVYIIWGHQHTLVTSQMGFTGSMIQMIAHGFSSTALFLAVGVLYDRLHTRKIQDFGGVAQSMPIFASFVMLFAMANVGLPGTSGFVGEFMVLLSSVQVNFWVTFLAATTLILAATYTLWMYKRVFFGAVTHERVAVLNDIGTSDKITMILLAAAVLWMGIYPQTIVTLLKAPVDHLLQISLHSKLP